MTMTPEVRRLLALAGLEVPAVELIGSGDGPRLTVLAGVHGCEYAPMAAVRRWVRQLAGRDLRGRVVAVPVLNLPAFQARTPFVVPADGKNLNRCFPGDPAGTLADRLAHAVFTELITGSDAVVDVHAGAGDPADSPRRAPVHLQRFLWLHCTGAGWWEPAVRPGEQVTAGQPLGTVTTVEGAETLEQITAPVAGVPLFITSSPAVAAGGLLLGLGAA